MNEFAPFLLDNEDPALSSHDWQLWDEHYETFSIISAYASCKKCNCIINYEGTGTEPPYHATFIIPWSDRVYIKVFRKDWIVWAPRSISCEEAIMRQALE